MRIWSCPESSPTGTKPINFKNMKSLNILFPVFDCASTTEAENAIRGYLASTQPDLTFTFYWADGLPSDTVECWAFMYEHDIYYPGQEIMFRTNKMQPWIRGHFAYMRTNNGEKKYAVFTPDHLANWKDGGHAPVKAALEVCPVQCRHIFDPIGSQIEAMNGGNEIKKPYTYMAEQECGRGDRTHHFGYSMGFGFYAMPKDEALEQEGILSFDAPWNPDQKSTFVSGGQRFGKKFAMLTGAALVLPELLKALVELEEKGLNESADSRYVTTQNYCFDREQLVAELRRLGEKFNPLSGLAERFESPEQHGERVANTAKTVDFADMFEELRRVKKEMFSPMSWGEKLDAEDGGVCFDKSCPVECEPLPFFPECSEQPFPRFSIVWNSDDAPNLALIEWKALEDEKPEDGQNCLVVQDPNRCATEEPLYGTWDEEAEGFRPPNWKSTVPAGWESRWSVVTHWAELPKNTLPVKRDLRTLLSCPRLPTREHRRTRTAARGLQPHRYTKTSAF